jgi:hypothetical protein
MHNDWIEKNIKGKKTLVVTAGESWTWGDSLPQDTRFTSIYGHHLANMLDSDFINVAKRGASNIEIHDQALALIEDTKDQYENTIVVFTLTELCREADWDRVWVPDCRENLTEFLLHYERAMLNSFKTNFIDRYPHIKFVIARNFTYTFDENKSVLGEQIEKTWIDVLADYQNKPEYPKDTRIVSSIGYKPLHKLLRHLDLYRAWKYDFLEYYAAADLAVTWLENSSLNYQEATKHPTDLGHKLWAEYLCEHLHGACRQVVKTSDCDSDIRGFESHQAPQHGDIA